MSHSSAISSFSWIQGKDQPPAEGTGIHTGGDGYKVPEMKQPSGMMREGMGHSMNVLVLTRALLTKTQVSVNITCRVV